MHQRAYTSHTTARTPVSRIPVPQYLRTPVPPYPVPPYPVPHPPRHRFIALSPARGSCAAPAAQAPRCTPASIAPQRRSPALNPLPPPPPTPQRSGGVSRGKGESKEGLGGNRNPPGPPWPPEAATGLRPQQSAAQGCAANPHSNVRTHSTAKPIAPAAERRIRTPPKPHKKRATHSPLFSKPGMWALPPASAYPSLSSAEPCRKQTARRSPSRTDAAGPPPSGGASPRPVCRVCTCPRASLSGGCRALWRRACCALSS